MQQSLMTCPRSHQQFMAKPRLVHRSPDFQFFVLTTKLHCLFARFNNNYNTFLRKERGLLGYERKIHFSSNTSGYSYLGLIYTAPQSELQECEL